MAKKKPWNKKLNRSDIAKEVSKRAGLRLKPSERRELRETADFFGEIIGFVIGMGKATAEVNQRRKREPEKLRIDDGKTIDAEWEEVTE